MPKTTFEVEGYECTRCHHKWMPRIKLDLPPRRCPDCKSTYWDRPVINHVLIPENSRISRAVDNKRRYEVHKKRAFLIVGKGRIECICGCGCTDIRFLEINHKNGRGDRKEFSGLSVYCAINSGRRKIDDLELTCKPYNHVHALMLKYGLKEPPFTIIWNKRDVEEEVITETPVSEPTIEIPAMPEHIRVAIEESKNTHGE